MNTEVDLKDLWNREGSTNIPDTKELFKKAAWLRKMARLRLIIQSAVLLVVTGVLLGVGFTIGNQQLTTIIGLWLMVAGVVSYLIATNQLLPMLFKSDIEGSTKAYLNQLIRIKRKNEFLDKVMIDVYFGLLFAGSFLFLLQFFKQMSIAKTVICVLTFGGLIICWFYSRTREIKKTMKPLNDTIKRLEQVNEQLKDSE